MTVNVDVEVLPGPSTTIPSPEGLVFPPEPEGGGEPGIGLGPEENPPKFPPQPPEGAESLFPSFLPDVEQIVWNALNDATQVGAFFPEDTDDGGLVLPVELDFPPDVGLFAETDPETYPTVNGIKNAPVKVVKGWPAYPGQVPAIGVAISTENEDGSGRLGQGGFAGDIFGRDEHGNIVASAAYYAEPLYSVVVVELIHENRDERDRIHDQLRRRLYPLRHLVPSASAIVKELAVQSEKNELPLDEQPLTIYVSVFTVEVWSEALIPTEIQINPEVVGDITVDVQIEA